MQQYLPKFRDTRFDAATLGVVNQPKIDAQDDMAFDLTLDSETAQLVRQLQEQKRHAIEVEDYAKAALLKTAVDLLMLSGEEMGKLVRFKQRAVESEDFESAALIKDQMDVLRLRLYESLGVKVSQGGNATLIARQQGLPPQQQWSQTRIRTPPLPAITATRMASPKGIHCSPNKVLAFSCLPQRSNIFYYAAGK